MPDAEVEEQSWPPSPTGQPPPSLAAAGGLPPGLKVGMVAAALGVLFTLWQLLRFISNQYPLLRFLPDMPAHSVLMILQGRPCLVIFSLPMLAVLALAGVGLAVGIQDWRVSRRAGRPERFWMTALGFALNLLPFVLFAKVFVEAVIE